MKQPGWEQLGTLPWGWLVAAFLAFVLGPCARAKPDPLPAGIRAGRALNGFQLSGESAVSLPGGAPILAVEGSWVKVRFGSDSSADRWINFSEIAGFGLLPGE